jgi:subtilisin family serine protease
MMGRIRSSRGAAAACGGRPGSTRSTTWLARALAIGLAACQDAVAPVAPRAVAAARHLSAAPNAAPDVIPDEYVVTFVDSVSDAPGLAKRFVAQHGGTVRFTYTAALKGFAAHLSAQAAAALVNTPQVAFVEQDRSLRASSIQASPDWGLDRLDQRALPLDKSFEFANDGAGVSVYVLDSGMRRSHVEFGGRAVSGYTAIADGRGTNDCGGHGTHVASTIGGAKYGVSKAVTLIAVRVLDCYGGGSTSGVIAGIDWVTRNRVLPAVANMSIEGTSSSTMNAAVQNSIKSGVVYTVAAGNDAGNACSFSPASTPEALTAAATTNSDNAAGYSNFGSCVDIYAPGSTIRAAYALDDTSSILMSGTSMASPHVAGAAALYLAANPSATPAQVSAALVGGATIGVISGVPMGTANLLLYTGVAGAATQPAPLPVPAPAPADAAPVASFSVSCVKSRCSFDGTGSTDDNGITSYAWSFGDGSTTASGSSLAKAIYSYRAVGSYTVSLTVRDAAGQSSVRSAVVTVKRL